MTFTKQSVTEGDLQNNPNLKRNGVSVDDDLVVNSNHDIFLYFLYRDRWDMGGTTNEWWLFGYQGHYLTLTVDMLDLVNTDGIKHLKLQIKEIATKQENSNKLQVVSLSSLDINPSDFFTYLNKVFSVYKSYGYSQGAFIKKNNFQVETSYTGE